MLASRCVDASTLQFGEFSEHTARAKALEVATRDGVAESNTAAQGSAVCSKPLGGVHRIL